MGKTSPSPPPPEARDKFTDSAGDPISQNIEAVLALYEREEKKLSRLQRTVEAVSRFVGQPLFLVCILVFVGLWIAAELAAYHLGWGDYDPAPFFWLQGTISLCALLTTIVVLITQKRLALFEEQRADLEMQVNILTEQKATKIIQLIEELRRDLPMVKDRHDPQLEALKQPMDARQMMDAVDEMRGANEPKSRMQTEQASDGNPEINA